MPRRITPMTAAEVARLRAPKRYWVGGVAGLMLLVTSALTKFWVCRVSHNGLRCDVRLGRYPQISLSQARDLASDVHRALRDGLNPSAHLPRAPVTARRQVDDMHTFQQATHDFLAFKEREWRNVKHKKQWRATLETHAGPIIGKMNVADIELSHLLKVLTPIWVTKTETATRVRARIEAVLDYAAVHGWRTGDNPARWKGLLDKTLPMPGKIRKTQHHPALPFEDVPALMQRLIQTQSPSARALTLLILTVVRSGEVRAARWDEFDLETGIWTIPAERMKSNRPHIVPLSRQAITLVTQLPRMAHATHYLFPAPVGHRPLSDMAMTKLLRDWNIEAVPHGFRSTFRDWVGDETEYDADLAEIALAHRVKCKTEAAYRRKTAVKRRRPLMQAWADAILPE